MTAAASPWFVRPRALARARLRLICLPHAGAGASTFFAWGAALEPAGIELRAVQYPGRENRLAEPLIDSAAAMTAALARAWPDLAGDGPCALFGHSMGALLAYELALELARRPGANIPRRIFLAGRNPPAVPPRLPPLHGLPDNAFLAAVAERYGNLPAAILAEPEMVALLLPVLRADFKLVDAYAWSGAPALSTPLTVLGGSRDPWTSAPELSGWRDYTRGACRLCQIEGGHFFPQHARDAVIAEIRRDIDGLA